MLSKNQNSLIIRDIYHKSTDIQQDLLFNSYHSQNWINSLFCTQAWTIYTMVTKKHIRLTHRQWFHVTLHRRWYPISLINKGFELAENMSLKEQRTERT